MGQATAPFQIVEATIDSIHSAFKSGQLTCRQLVQTYIDRIGALDKAGPAINSIIAVSSTALAEADCLDEAYRSSGPIGPLHGIPVILKDQIDAQGMATTLGSVLFKNFYPVHLAYRATVSPNFCSAPGDSAAATGGSPRICFVVFW